MNKNVESNKSDDNNKDNSQPQPDSIFNKKSPPISEKKNNVPESECGSPQKKPTDNEIKNESNEWSKKHSRINLWIQGILAGLNFLALIAFSISIIYQGYLTRKALQKTDSANFYTLQSLNETKRLNDISQQTLIHSILSDSENGFLAIADTQARDRNTKMELRAYLSIKDFNFISYNNNGSIVYQVIVVNTGKTPAYDIYPTGNVKIWDISKHGEITWCSGVWDKDWDKFKKVDFKKSHTPQDVKGGGLDIVFTCFVDNNLSSQDSVDIVKGNHPLYVYGIIFYNDIFKTQHKIRFCRILDPASRSFFAYERYNDEDYHK